jgi:hypothetical protein
LDRYGDDGKKWKGVIPHFVMISRKEPTQKLKESMPNGKIIWMKLEIPEDLKSVVRCDENSNPNKKGAFWKVAPRLKTSK